MTSYEDICNDLRKVMKKHEIGPEEIATVACHLAGLVAADPDKPKTMLTSMDVSNTRFGRYILHKTGNGNGTPIDLLRKTKLGYRIAADKRLGQSMTATHWRNLIELQDSVDDTFRGTQAATIWFRGPEPYKFQTADMYVDGVKPVTFTRTDSAMDWFMGRQEIMR